MSATNIIQVPIYEEIYDIHHDSAGNLHFIGIITGQHIIRNEEIIKEDTKI